MSMLECFGSAFRNNTKLMVHPGVMGYHTLMTFSEINTIGLVMQHAKFQIYILILNTTFRQSEKNPISFIHNYTRSWQNSVDNSKIMRYSPLDEDAQRLNIVCMPLLNIIKHIVKHQLGVDIFLDRKVLKVQIKLQLLQNIDIHFQTTVCDKKSYQWLLRTNKNVTRSSDLPHMPWYLRRMSLF